jgi:hypothetical protein
MRTIANWLLALPEPDPDLEYELIVSGALPPFFNGGRGSACPA